MSAVYGYKRRRPWWYCFRFATGAVAQSGCSCCREWPSASRLKKKRPAWSYEQPGGTCAEERYFPDAVVECTPPDRRV